MKAMLLAAALCLTWLGPESRGQTERPQAPEYQVKAAFLLNFVKFVTWPPLGDGRQSSPVSICIPGEDPFQEALDVTVRGEAVDGRRIVVERASGLPLSTCDVIFVRREHPNTGRILAEAGTGVLTVGEGEQFLDQGGMIAFVVENRRVRFDINQPAVAKASLRLSSRMLTVARMVRK